MSSSISSSEAAAAAEAPAWRGWLVTFVAVLVGGLACLYVFVLLADPFSTGRFTPFRGVDITLSIRAFSNAGRVRDRAFDAAVIGNSRAARFAPAQLDALTGRHFVQLSVFSTGPGDQLAMARAFVREHAGMSTAVLFAIDQAWCNEDEAESYPHFPFWLYGTSDREYFANIFSPIAVQAAFKRLAMRFFAASAAGPLDGFDPQEPSWPPDRFQQASARPRPFAAALRYPRPWIAPLGALVAEVPEATRIALVILPYYVAKIPLPGSPAAAALDACKAEFRAIAAHRRNVAVFDFLGDDAVTGDIANFSEPTHVHDSFARTMVGTIAPALRP